jgi:hypothetical protein
MVFRVASFSTLQFGICQAAKSISISPSAGSRFRDDILESAEQSGRQQEKEEYITPYLVFGIIGKGAPKLLKTTCCNSK